MPIVVDVSVALPWNIASQGNEISDRAAQAVVRDGGIVPFHFHLEHANALVSLCRRRRLTESDVTAALQNMLDLGLEVDYHAADVIEHVTAPLAIELGLTVYDAIYLEVAQRTGWPLATRDIQLADAARRKSVKVFAD